MGNSASKLEREEDGVIGLGYLEVIIGPMFSGKTSRLVDIYKEHIDEYQILVINHKSDDRYGEKDCDQMYTHDQMNIPCVYVETLSELADSKSIPPPHIILINEGNFFPDLVPYVLNQVEKMSNIVYVAGLDGDFQRHKFGHMISLIPYANKVTKLSGKCHSCSRKSLFSYRVDRNNMEQKLVGTNVYLPLCRPCYLKYSVDESDYSQLVYIDSETINAVMVPSMKPLTRTKNQADTSEVDVDDRREMQVESSNWDPFGSE